MCVCVQIELKRRIAKRYVSTELQSKRQEKQPKKKNYKHTHTAYFKMYLGSAVLWFLEKRLSRRRGKRGQKEKNDERERAMEADISRVGALEEHLIIIYIRSVSPSPQNGQIQQREKQRARERNTHV